MGNFFRDLRKLYKSLEELKKEKGESTYAKRGERLIALLGSFPLKELKKIDKKKSFIEKLRENLLESGFRIHIRNKKVKLFDPLTGKSENFFVEIVFNGEEVIIKWHSGIKVFAFEEMGEDYLFESLKEHLDRFLVKDSYKAPEKLPVRKVMEG